MMSRLWFVLFTVGNHCDRFFFSSPPRAQKYGVTGTNHAAIFSSFCPNGAEITCQSRRSSWRAINHPACLLGDV